MKVGEVRRCDVCGTLYEVYDGREYMIAKGCKEMDLCKTCYKKVVRALQPPTEVNTPRKTLSKASSSPVEAF